MSTWDSRIVRSVTVETCPSPRPGAARSRIVAGRPALKVGVSDLYRPSHRGGHLPRAVDLLEPARRAARINGHPCGIERAARSGSACREPAPSHDRPQILGPDRYAGERLQGRRRRRAAKHTSLARQDERGVLANRHVHEDGLSRRRELQTHPRGGFETRIELRAQSMVARFPGNGEDCGHRPHRTAPFGGELVGASVVRVGAAGARRQRDEPWCAGGGREAEGGRKQANPAIHIRPRASRILFWILVLSIDWPSPPSARSQAAAASANRRCLKRRSPR